MYPASWFFPLDLYILTSVRKCRQTSEFLLFYTFVHRKKIVNASLGRAVFTLEYNSQFNYSSWSQVDKRNCFYFRFAAVLLRIFLVVEIRLAKKDSQLKTRMEESDYKQIVVFSLYVIFTAYLFECTLVYYTINFYSIVNGYIFHYGDISHTVCVSASYLILVGRK